MRWGCHTVLGQAAYKLAFEISPITLTGGVAQNIPGGMLPVLAISHQNVSRETFWYDCGVRGPVIIGSR